MHIVTEDIRVKINEFNILNGINIDVKNKEFVGIIGPNGSGKSTLLKCIYRTLKPSGGIVKLDDIDLNDLSVKESSKKIAVLSQHNNYSFDFTVRDIVLMGRAPHKKFLERDSKEDYDIMYDALKKVDMLDFLDRSFHTLSGGEQQRIILARALTQQTDCLILDEPTKGVDVGAKREIYDLIKDLTNKGVSIILISSDLPELISLSNRIYVIHEGKIQGELLKKDASQEKIMTLATGGRL